MEHVPSTESDIEKVYRIARELGIGLEEAAITCDAFHLAFSDEGLRRAIFGLIDELDDEAYRKGEPLGMILSYAVELGIEGIQVTRHANEIPPGQVVSLTPTNRAMIFVKIKDNFPTNRGLGPLILERPASWSEPRAVATGFFSSEGFATRRSSSTRSESAESEIPTERSSFQRTEPVIPEPARTVIWLGPIRQTFNERFPFVSATHSSSQPPPLARTPAFQSKALDSHHHLPPWAALPAGMPAFQSGHSPPRAIGECGHSVSKDVPGLLAVDA